MKLRTEIICILLSALPATSLHCQDVKPAKANESRQSQLVEQLQRVEWNPGKEKAESTNTSNVSEQQHKAYTIIDFAKKFIGCRYRSGGKGPTVFDCSGFTGYVFRQFGYTMGASSRDQYLQGDEVKVENLKPGDLMFFGGRGGRRKGSSIGHVALVVDVNPDTKVVKFIHASSNVGITINQYPDGGYYSNRYVGARRIM